MPVFGSLNPVQVATALRRWGAAAARRVRPDHRSIGTIEVKFPGTLMNRFYLYVAVAPSRSATRSRDDGQVSRARAFAEDLLPGIFGPEPSYSFDGMTVFTVNPTGRTVERALYVHRSGLIELLWALTPTPTNDGKIVLDVEEMIAVIGRLVLAVGRSPYADISRAGRGRRRFARLDWRFNLAAAISSTEGERSWSGLRFPDVQPQRARDQRPSPTPVGYGLEKLRNTRRSTHPARLARVFVTDMLVANGYFEVSAAVEQGLESGLNMLELPPAPMMLDAGPVAPTMNQVKVLNRVFEHFMTQGERVPFPTVDKQLDQDGIALREHAESMPTGLLLPIVDSRGGFFRDDDQLMVTREALRYCEGGNGALDLLARTLAYFAKREKPFVPTDSTPKLIVTNVELEHALGLTVSQLQQVRLMLDEYEWSAYSSQSSDDTLGTWSITIAREQVRRFRGVVDGQEYLRALGGESFAGQLDRDDQLTRFALACDGMLAPIPDGQLVTVLVKNLGPADSFQATVESATEVEQAAVPWHIRWRDNVETTQQILSGQTSVLELAREDSAHRNHRGRLTPGFVFLQSEDREHFVRITGHSNPGGTTGAAMRVAVRVTSTSQPDRALENTVALNITEAGVQALWDRQWVAHQ